MSMIIICKTFVINRYARDYLFTGESVRFYFRDYLFGSYL